MQEDQTVSFQPMYVDGEQPWITKLFVLYLFIVLIVFLVRVVDIAVRLHKLKRAKKQAVPDGRLDGLWSELHVKANFFKDLSAITFLFALLDFTWCIIDDLASIRFEKTTSVAILLPRIAGGMVPLALGLIFCIVLYSTAMILQGLLRCRRAAVSGANLKA